jgi:hypothetical protein
MSGLLLLRVFDAVYLIALGTWLGSLVFTQLVVMPNLARRWMPEQGRSVRGLLLARVGLWGAVCGAIALPALVCGALGVPEMRGPGVGARAALILACLLSMLYLANVVALAVAGGGERGALEAGHLDRHGAVLTGLVVICLAGLLVSHAFRESPRSKGIIELGPRERYRKATGMQEPAQSGSTPAKESDGSDAKPVRPDRFVSPGG